MQLRLSPILNEFITDQQFAFLSGHSIHHALLLTNESVHATIRSHLQYVFMKMDIVKAFDMLEWNFMFQVLQKVGFKLNFINFIKALTSNANSTILINSILTESFLVTRSMRQGCPLSLLLFIIVVDVLSRLFNKVAKNGHIKVVQMEDATMHYMHGMYADDLSLILEADSKNIQRVQQIIDNFGDASSLRSKWEATKAYYISNNPLPS